VLAGRFDLALAVRVVTNLVENAHKYSPAGEPIDIRAFRDGDQVDLQVLDRGPGIALAEREQIFTRFYRPSGAPPDAGSAGLGLALAREMALIQQGSVSHSPREGGGSVFTLRLPASRVEDRRGAASAAEKFTKS
jgi:signal transduction histidine kinase